VPGSKIGDMLSFARYDKSQVWANFRKLVEDRVVAGKLSTEQGDQLIRDYESDVDRYTYLE
jgi:arginine decarboxylase-like protein